MFPDLHLFYFGIIIYTNSKSKSALFVGVVVGFLNVCYIRFVAFRLAASIIIYWFIKWYYIFPEPLTPKIFQSIL